MSQIVDLDFQISEEVINVKVRHQDILRRLLLNQNISEQELENKLGISSRQLRYSIEQINEQLIDEKIPVIEKRQGNYYCSERVADFLKIQSGLNEFSLSAEDRVQVIILTILSRIEEMSLDHLTISLQVSKNTVLSDMKKCNDYLRNHQLSIKYSRKEGYYIDGDEWDKRMMLSSAINHVYRNYGEKSLSQLLSHCDEDKGSVNRTLLKIEQYLGIKYTDEDFYPLIYFISTLLVRIRQKKQIDSLEFLDVSEIVGTKEYQSLIHLSDDFVGISDQEVMYISLQLLRSSSLDRLMKEEDLPLLANSLWEFFTEFETNARLILPEKRELLRKFINHFKPAYYRIKYRLPIENALYEQITTKYSVLHSFVRQSISPLEKFFQVEISDKEVAYITMFIGGHILGENDSSIEKKVIKAVILCPNGVSVSKLMEKNLQNLFPEFLFYPPNTIREYQGFMLPHDIVFSTIPVDSDELVYVVSELFTNSEQLKLRRRVIKDVFNLDFATLQSEDIVDIVKQHAKVDNVEKLTEALDSLLIRSSGDLDERVDFTGHQGLLSLISEQEIRIIKKTPMWEKLLLQASEILIDKGKIPDTYSSLLIEAYKDMPDYIVLNQEIALPHLDPEMVDQKLGVSMLVLKEGLMYQGKLVHIVMLMTIPDKESHIGVLFEINRLARNEEFVQQVKLANTPEQIMQLIGQFVS